LNVRTDNTSLALDGPVILEAVVGSKAYGMDTPDSDTDTVGIYVAPINRIIGLSGLSDKASTRVDPNKDSVYHELGKFARLAIVCNPTLVELLWLQDYLVQTPEGEALRSLRHAYLSTNKVRNSYAGYALQQAKKLAKRPDHPRYAKHGRHCFRLLMQAEQLLTTGELRVKLTPEERDKVFHLGSRPPEEVTELFERFLARIDTIDSVLPDKPNLSLVGQRLLEIRWSLHATEN
jgi:predicted nucleotidyltransferase